MVSAFEAQTAKSLVSFVLLRAFIGGNIHPSLDFSFTQVDNQIKEDLIGIESAMVFHQFKFGILQVLNSNESESDIYENGTLLYLYC